jgi:hypothetical protein
MLRSVILAVCICASLAGKYPPAFAQSGMTPEDATQDANIAAINKHLESTDANVLRQETALNLNAMQIAELQGEERVFFGVLGVLTSISIVIQVKKKGELK